MVLLLGAVVRGSVCVSTDFTSALGLERLSRQRFQPDGPDRLLLVLGLAFDLALPFLTLPMGMSGSSSSRGYEM